jgi:hypothetical protein
MRRALFLSIPLMLLSASCTYDNGDARRVYPSDGYAGAGSPGGGSIDPGSDGGAGSNGGATNEPPGCNAGPDAVQAWIDVNAQIETSPGEGAGVFVEYAAGGHWSLRTTCDILKNNTPCAWDIIVTSEDGRSISHVLPQDLEAGTDSVRAYPDDPRSYQLIAQTSGDLDGFTFDSQPQAAILVDVFLDGACALPFFFWVGDGAIHKGAPSNPIVLVPTPE